MNIQINNHNPYWLVFKYENKLNTQHKMSGKFLEEKRITKAILFQDKVEIAEASVVCHKQDRFTKSNGRKQAIVKLLEILGLTREEKKEFWSQYLAYTTPAPTVTIPLELYNKLISFNS